MQAKVITLKGKNRVLLVIVTETNVQVHDLLDNAILFVYTIDETEFVTIREISSENFANGITLLNKNQSIYIGLVNGSLLSLNTSDIDSHGIVSCIEPGPNAEPITDIFASDSLVALGYSSGKSCVLELKRKRSPSMGLLFDPQLAASSSHSSTPQDSRPFVLRTVVQFESFNDFPCTNVALCSDNILVSFYGSGHIRLFSVVQMRLLSEVYAHKSWINSLHLVPSFDPKRVGRVGARRRKSKKVVDEECEIVPFQEDGKNDDGEEEDEEQDDDGRSDLEKRSQFLLSASDDSFVRVWKVNQYYPWIQLEWSTSIKNKLPVGACFLNNSPQSFAVTSYDSNQVDLFERKQKM